MIFSARDKPSSSDALSWCRRSLLVRVNAALNIYIFQPTCWCRRMKDWKHCAFWFRYSAFGRRMKENPTKQLKGSKTDAGTSQLATCFGCFSSRFKFLLLERVWRRIRCENVAFVKPVAEISPSPLVMFQLHKPLNRDKKKCLNPPGYLYS